jgi:transposase
MISSNMDRYKDYEPEQGMWVDFRPDVLFPQGSYERFLVTTIKEIDVTGFWEKADSGGESPYDPRGMLGLIFYGISTGIFSSRKMETGCRDHLGFMYVSGHMKPDHSSICRFMVEHYEAIKEVFGMVLYLAHQQGFLDYEKIAIDGTKIKANASKRFSGTIEAFQNRKKKFEKKIELALEKLQSADEEEERKYWERKKKRYEENHRKLAAFLKQAQKQKTKRGTERTQNITDPESRMMKLGKEYQQGYNAQIGVSGGSGLIVAADVVNDENDQNMLPHMTNEVKKNQPAGATHEDDKYLLDNGYMSRAAMEHIQETKMDVYLPTSADKHAYDDNSKENERISVEECILKENETGITLTCPGGRCFKKEKLDAREVYTFTAGVASNCEGCEHFERCRGQLKGADKKFEVTADYLKIAGFLEEHRKKMKTDEARRIYSSRMDIVEKIFGQIKEDWGYKKILRRTLSRVKCEWLFVAIAYNVKRFFKLSMNQLMQGSVTA